MAKKLYKVEQDKKICGVCGGFAEYFDIDVSIVRILFACSIFFCGGGLLAYIICALIMPKKNEFIDNNDDYKID